MKYYLAVDIGASSGRHILCHVENKKIILEEIYRFKNNVINKNNHFYWDIKYLFNEVKQGLKECARLNKIPESMGIDTWAVDYALLNENEELIRDVFAYRDNRTEKNVKEVFKKILCDELYEKTGIQYQKFNTIYQLASDAKKDKEESKHFLMVPDYLNYLLTGKMVNEYTNMSTTQLLDIKTNKLSDELIEITGFNKDIFSDMVMPGENIGCLKKDIVGEIGFDLNVIVPATHDTGSAYMAAIEKESIIISSGTWSLLGIETQEPIIKKEAEEANFTNEGGYEFRYRFLKNIMGLWIIQEVSRKYQGKYSFGELVELARKEVFEGIFDVNDDRFLKPENMIEEIKNYFEEKNEKAPRTPGEIAYCVYNSLAYCYKEAAEELEAITGRKFGTINIIGGGCQNGLLNEIIAKVCNKKVVAGPIEATALGNIVCQLISNGIVSGLDEGRKMIKESFEINEY
ncbi:rhamnulokinase [Clostridium butyricum]|uniref:rhamnulokinase n=1 Tax=Clostridium butyricum TaxID=1492 RepID=UPI00374F9846